MKQVLLLLSFICVAQTFKAQSSNDNTVYKWYQVQEKAEFPGGYEAMDKYIRDNMVIPNKAFKKAKSGTIVVKFIVEKDGSLSDVKISSNVKIGYGCEQAAVNVIKGMPKWSPALQRDAPCRMEFQKPIRLTFN